MLAAVFSASAETFKQKTIVEITGKYAKVTNYSVLYVGEIAANGEATIKYLYSDDISRYETIFAAVRDAMQGMEDTDTSTETYTTTETDTATETETAMQTNTPTETEQTQTQ